MGGPGLIDGRLIKSTDNFFPIQFTINGTQFCSSENYFQCVKCVDPKEFERVRNSGCGADVWRAGSVVKLRKDWEIVKVRVMYEGNKAKFEQNEEIKKVLLATHGNVTFSASTAFWCKWNGRIIELVREELRPESERNEDKIKEIWGLIHNYEEKQKKKAGDSSNEQ